ncbi:MAG TPA: S1/P1 nuclease [Noviherbaspirillum sp.]
MTDYARGNNTNCPNWGKNVSCNKSFHFADIDIEHDSYATRYVDAHDYDIVHAIDAAILVLQDQPSNVPFNFASKKEALMLIAHFVGDLHQPLHVGAIYLAPDDGSAVDPDAGAYDPAPDTTGGNAAEAANHKGRCAPGAIAQSSLA